MKRYRFTLGLTFLVVAGVQALAQAQGEVLIKNATIMTASHGTIENGSILISNGKIVAVGKDVTGGSGAKVIDATGMYVTPGFVDAHSHTAADGGVNEGSLSVSAMVRMRDVVNDRDPNIYRQLAGGTTTIHLMHGSANSIGGQNVVLKLRWGKTAEEMVFTEAPRTIKFALGENPKRAGNPQNPFGGGRPPRYPATRMGVAETIREAFTEGREYVQKWDAYEAAIKRGEKPLAPKRDLKLDAIADILRGKLLIHSHCYRADEILMLMEVAREFGFKIQTFQHVLEGYKVAKEIAAHGAGGSTFSDWWAYKMEAYDAIPGNAAIMSNKGVVVSINSDSADLARRLYQEAAKTIKYGNVSEEEALRFVTLNPARQLKIDHRVGSIDAGKDADLAIFNGHPFSIYSRVEMTLIEGAVYFDRKVDLARREQVAREKKALIEAERRSAGQPQATPATPAPPPTPNVEEEEHPHPNR